MFRPSNDIEVTYSREVVLRWMKNNEPAVGEEQEWRARTILLFSNINEA